MSKIMIITIIGLVGIGGAWWAGQSIHHQPAPAACVAAANEVCPPPDFMDEYNQWISLKHELDESDYQAKADRLSGISQRLQANLPPGYIFNTATRKFVHTTPPPQPGADTPAVKK